MAIFDELKAIGGVLQEAGKIEQYKQILDAQKELLEMQKKISDLESDNKELKEKLKSKEELFFENNAYWVKKDGNNDGPFCSCCWDDDKKTIRMMPGSHPAYVSCPKCSNKSVKVYPGRESPPQSNRMTPRFNNYR